MFNNGKLKEFKAPEVDEFLTTRLIALSKLINLLRRHLR